MVTPVVRQYLYRLDDINKLARRNFSHCSSLYMHYVMHEFMRYWRELQKTQVGKLYDCQWNELYFFFNEKLYEIARCRLDIMWLIYEFDGECLFHSGHKVKPFWR